MYTERVSEIIDDLIFDDRHLSRKEMRNEGIRLILEADLRRAGWNRSYIKPFYSKKPMELARNYYDPDVREEDVIGFFDETLLGSGVRGILFCSEGMFVREIWSDPIFIPYNRIISGKITATKERMVLPFSDGGEKEVFISCRKERMGQMIRLIVELYKRLENRTVS